MGISSPGIGSGLNVQSIVSQLVSADRVPLDTLHARESTYTTKLSAYGSIKSALASFQTALTTLGSGGLGAQIATSGNAAAVGVTATTGASSGTYSIQVDQLARQNKQISGAVSDVTTPFATGSLSIQVGTGTAINLPNGSYSLKGLSDAINTANAGVSAAIINDGTGTPYHLVITSKGSGTANSATITATGGLAQFASSSPSTTQIPAMDAKLTIDGLPITRSSNQVTDAITGLTLNLQQVTTAPTTVSAVRDDTTIKANITAFVKAYNALSTTIGGLTAYDPASKKGQPLTGDSGPTSIVASLHKQLSTSVTSSGAFSSLASIGITTQRDGTLAVDDTKLSKAIATNVDGIAKLFTNTDGVATRLLGITTSVLADTGVIATKTNGLTSSITNLKKQEDALSVRLTAKEAQYQRQFSALDSLLNGLQNTGTYLASQLASLPKTTS